MTSTVNLPTNSTATPCEVFTTLLQLSDCCALLPEYRCQQLLAIYSVSDYCAVIFLLLLSSGCRVSEILDINCSDIRADGTVIIRGKKGSSSRQISAVGCSLWLASKRNGSGKLFYAFNYSFIYRLFKKHGIVINGKKGERAIVTHSLRYDFIGSFEGKGVENKLISEVIGHKNEKNTALYQKKLRERRK